MSVTDETDSQNIEVENSDSQNTDNEDHNPTMVCRGCLKRWGEMKNMFQWGLDVDFFRYTEIPRNPSEGMPELLCASCEEDLLKAKSFKERCQQIDKVLRLNMKKSDKETPVSRAEVTSELEEDRLVFRITAPSPEDKILFKCPFDYCSMEFFKKILLHTHLLKTHNFSNTFEIVQKFYCTEEGCVYSIKEDKKFFTGRKNLNQHYNKIHKDRIFSCSSCSTKFATVSDYYRHLKSCNITYKCPKCTHSYTKREPLLVHLLRRHPELHAKYKKEKKSLKRTAEVGIPVVSQPEKIVKRKVLETFPNSNVVSKQTNVVKATELSQWPGNNIDEAETYSENQATTLFDGRIVKGKVFKTLLNSDVVSKPTNVVEATELSQWPGNNVDEAKRFTEYQETKVFIGKIVQGKVFETCPNSDVGSKLTKVVKSTGLSQWPDNIIEAEKYTGDQATEVIEEDSVGVGVDIAEEVTIGDYAVDDGEVTINVRDGIPDEETFEEQAVGVFGEPDTKRTLATQIPEDLANDESLNSWSNRTDFELSNEMSTQTVFEDLLSIKPQNSEDEIYFPESVSLSDIQTQTVPLEFGLSRRNKETQSCNFQSQSPDFSMKETQTCFCLYDPPRLNFRHFDSLSSSPGSSNYISTETQTGDAKNPVRSDVFLSFSSAETQTCFDDAANI